jgi:hypothetical protein
MYFKYFDHEPEEISGPMKKRGGRDVQR